MNSFDDIEFRGPVSPDFKALVQAANDALRPAVRGYLRDMETIFAAGQIQDDVSPENIGEQNRRKNDTRRNQNNTVGQFDSKNNRITVAEFTLDEYNPKVNERPVQGRNAGDWKKTSPEVLKYAVVHEAYHALNKHLGFPTLSIGFLEAYRKDILKLGGARLAILKGYGYWIQRDLPGVGPDEVFADAGAAIDGVGMTDIEYAFPRCVQWTKEFLTKFEHAYAEGPQAVNELKEDTNSLLPKWARHLAKSVQRYFATEARMATARQPQLQQQQQSRHLPADEANLRQDHEPFSKAQLLADIYTVRPDLANQPVREPDSGLTSHTIIIGNEVFKGPKGAWATAPLMREAEIMQRLEGTVFPIPIPAVTSLSESPPWFGITLLEGIGLHKVPHFLSLDKRDQVARPVGLFLAALAKAIPSQEGLEQYIVKETGSDSAEVKEILSRPEVQDILGPLLSACRQAANRVDDFKPVMTHGDVQPSNILVDETTGEVKGIIDFGAAGFRLPQAALSDLARSFDLDFVDRVRIAYFEAQDKKIERRDIVFWEIANQAVKIPKLTQDENGLKKAVEKIGDLNRELAATQSTQDIKQSVRSSPS